MFRAILETQWKWTRAGVLLATIFAFALPVASLQDAQYADRAIDFVVRMDRWGGFYALLAAGLGLGVALAAWSHDQRGRHVYALTLPVSRARYALMRLGAGAVFLVPPALAVLAGGLAVATLGGIPQGLHAYPVSLALRFVFAAMVSYAMFFAIAASTQKTAGIILGAFAAVLLAQYGLALAEVKFDLLRKVFEFAFNSPGVFSVFTGRWSLIDA